MHLKFLIVIFLFVQISIPTSMLNLKGKGYILACNTIT